MKENVTPRQNIIAALEGRQPAGRAPHFELVFFPTMEAFGKVHPLHRDYAQWNQMKEKERELHRRDVADVLIRTAERYDHSAIFVHLPRGADGPEEFVRQAGIIRERTGDKYLLLRHGDATLGLKRIETLSYRIADDPDGLKAEAARKVDDAIALAEKHFRGVFDGFAMCSDYAFNSSPFLSPAQFSEFITPYLARLVKAYRDMGFYTVKHTDGNIMPIIDQIVQCRPHALHSLDPQGGVDIAVVKKLYGKQICLIGNVNCGLMDTGSEAEVIASVRYALKHGMPGGGYVFSTSNCIYTGMPLERYELVHRIWREEAKYD